MPLLLNYFFLLLFVHILFFQSFLGFYHVCFVFLFVSVSHFICFRVCLCQYLLSFCILFCFCIPRFFICLLSAQAVCIPFLKYWNVFSSQLFPYLCCIFGFMVLLILFKKFFSIGLYFFVSWCVNCLVIFTYIMCFCCLLFHYIATVSFTFFIRHAWLSFWMIFFLFFLGGRIAVL